MTKWTHHLCLSAGLGTVLMQTGPVFADATLNSFTEPTPADLPPALDPIILAPPAETVNTPESPTRILISNSEPSDLSTRTVPESPVPSAVEIANAPIFIAPKSDLVAPLPITPAPPQPSAAASEQIPLGLAGPELIAVERQRLGQALKLLIAQKQPSKASDTPAESLAVTTPERLVAEQQRLTGLLNRAVSGDSSAQRQVRTRHNLAAHLNRGTVPGLASTGSAEISVQIKRPPVPVTLAMNSSARELSPRVLEAIQSVVGQRFNRFGCVDLVQEVRRRMGLPTLAFQGQSPTRYVPHLAHLLMQQGARSIQATEAQAGDIVIGRGHTGIVLNANTIVHNSTRQGYRGATMSMNQWQRIWPGSRIFRPTDIAQITSP
ncbi:hypothetical protein [Leptolyngbya sp. FACHB-261]|uniref:hypothetical protein n=1 Tax=Leptolyngbya sp. FACHB-261 TaxID=2692806 RepID=UPI0016850248|nr:hypothetical protein [Leptolyngbya sp. FACHB-261]MBD2103501.1 hypothetical protein [Leptolyngbya sp. FACHB-261]